MAFSLRNTTLLTNMWHFRPEILFLSPKVAFSPRNTICSQIDDLFPPTVRRFLPQMPVCFGIPPISSLRDYITLRRMTFSPGNRALDLSETISIPNTGHFLPEVPLLSRSSRAAGRCCPAVVYVSVETQAQTGDNYRNVALKCLLSAEFLKLCQRFCQEKGNFKTSVRTAIQLLRVGQFLTRFCDNLCLAIPKMEQ